MPADCLPGRTRRFERHVGSSPSGLFCALPRKAHLQRKDGILIEMASQALPSPSLARLSSRSHVAQRLPQRVSASARSAARVRSVVVAEKKQKQDVICVTGATGFVGKALVKQLVGQGAKVRVLTRCACNYVCVAQNMSAWPTRLPSAAMCMSWARQP